ncbi:MAG: thiamine pyrophosphate-dependent enzyme [Bacteroidales bacterium]|nr:thiamine pyrophosphate-dependent enzyme [Bacteroidales bacterium]
MTTFTALHLSKKDILNDYYTALLSRQISYLGRKEVLTGKAKFGILGDGKEIPQLAMAHVFQAGDWRSGYYRDQTFMLAAGMVSPQELFSQLYGDTNTDNNPASSGRMMNNHYATPTLDETGEWRNLTQQKISSADISPTAGQMPRLLGLAMASKYYRAFGETKEFNKFTVQGNEVAFGTIGDASTSEGHFFEVMNAAAVLQVPLAMSVWDDGYGISVPKKFQTAKESISKALSGMEAEKEMPGITFFEVKGWDYEAAMNAYAEGIKICRNEQVPVLFHFTELTQPQGHSTSGSHERYKSTQRLEWETQFDGIERFRQWILDQNIATEDALTQLKNKAIQAAKEANQKAWNHFIAPLKSKRDELVALLEARTCSCSNTPALENTISDLKRVANPVRKDSLAVARQIIRNICHACPVANSDLKARVRQWIEKEHNEGKQAYSSHLYSQSERAVKNLTPLPPVYSANAKEIPGREILRDNFDYLMEQNPGMLAFGEDVGKIGGVNQTWEGLQQKYGKERIFDTGIREASIVGQAIGMAMRGLRPIAEIQYFDYLLYGLQVLSDDLATLQYRTKGRQKAPVIISTRGHRLEGIWHAGSPLSMVINSIRGVHVLVPRNMTIAAGFYNAMMASDEPALIIEPLNGYRLREKKPDNIGQYRIIPGYPEILQKGKDITLVTYGSCVRIAREAIEQLRPYEISVELIDVQSLIPFDIPNTIGESLKKTNKIVFFDEDVPGGATAFMLQQVMEKNNGYYSLDEAPVTVTADNHRAAYGTDGDYFSNPNAEDVFEAIYRIMHQNNPKRFPNIL